MVRAPTMEGTAQGGSEVTTYKILIAGNSVAGKSAFLFRYSEDTFTSSYIPTIGVDFRLKTVTR